MSSIFVVDDSAGARQFALAALGRAGHTVRDLDPTCLLPILQALHEAPPDLLITDLVMPGCPGMTLIRVCREDPHLRQMRILLLTSHGDEKLGLFLQSMGNVHYLAKPVAPQVLQECVARLLSPEEEPDPGWSLACNGIVAVVDDSQLSRSYHAACLRKSGFRPVAIEPTNLLATVEAIEAAGTQLLVADFRMPDFNGDALIRAIRGRQAVQDIPVLVVTSHNSEELRDRLSSIAKVEILFKPLTPADLVAAVRRALDREQA